MLPSDTEYYRLRAATERELAGQYEALIENPELHGILRAVS